MAFLRSLPSETISPRELAKVAGGDPYSYNLAAKEGRLDLPHLWRGRNLRIWKEPVIRLIGGSDVQEVSDGERKADEGEDDRHRSDQLDALRFGVMYRRFFDGSSSVDGDLRTK